MFTSVRLPWMLESSMLGRLAELQPFGDMGVFLVSEQVCFVFNPYVFVGYISLFLLIFLYIFIFLEIL